MLVGLTDEPLTITKGTLFSYFQQQIRGHYGSEPEHVLQLVDLVGGGRLDFARSVSRVHPLKDAAEAVRALEHEEGDPIRLVPQP